MLLKSLKYLLLLALTLSASLAHAKATLQETILLPEDFRIYTKDNQVINQPYKDFREKILPTRNIFEGAPGGYIACYSHVKKGSVYPVADDIFVMGQIRLPGRYFGRIFHPAKYENKDISAAKTFKNQCNAEFSSCKQQCWAGGDTGGWFGIK